MRKEMKRLHRLGFAVHLLQPRSKKPIENKWTSGKRKTLNELKNNYKPGMNIGVRLGSASKIEGAYLAVIDCDVKSKEKRHIQGMENTLASIFEHDLDDAPLVMSGRGNGSRHYYIVTKEPVKPQRLTQSTEMVKVHMPSVKPSTKDKERLSTKEIAEGVRLRAAWEISMMGEGQQVVLPPSVHPDSGKNYVWARPVKDATFLPLVNWEGKDEEESDSTTLEDFEVEEVYLDLERVSDRIKKMIRTGEGCDDRSAGLFASALALCGAGLTDNQILTVLSDRDNYLGGVAYEHTQSASRKRAAEWLRKYTLKRARRETDAARDFEDLVVVERLSPEEAEIQKAKVAEEIETCETWRSLIERSGKGGDGPPKPTLKNMITILTGAVGVEVFKRDEFAARDIHGGPNPWKGEGEVKDIDLINIKKWCANELRFEPHTALVNEAVQTIAHKNRYHPVRKWLGELPAWDGVPRLEGWLSKYMSAHSADEKYLKAVSKRVILSMIARVMKPGCKVDTVMVFYGDQGLKKSTMTAALASPWGSDAKLDMNDKDGVLVMMGAWIVELGELSSLGRSEIDAAKEFVARGVDRIRLPYGKRPEDFPRQCIFMGTTNNFEFLRDETGNRRFWPVSVGKCYPEKFKRVREQIFAEAMIDYAFGERWWLTSAEEELAKVQQSKHLISDTLDEKLAGIFRSKPEHFNTSKFTLSQLMDLVSDQLGLKDDRSTHLRLGRCLRVLGYRKTATTAGEGVVRKMWVKE